VYTSNVHISEDFLPGLVQLSVDIHNIVTYYIQVEKKVLSTRTEFEGNAHLLLVNIVHGQSFYGSIYSLCDNTN